jgi:hypothetical protein
MKLTVVLAVLSGILVLACSNAALAPVEPTPHIDAIVEAKGKEVVAPLPTNIPYLTYTSVPTPSQTPSPTPTSLPTNTPYLTLINVTAGVR